ncbi:MAG TPA: four-carbon acid sugar kinase family protein [Opitutaceae bacterium]|nr:four-carbon acid sugar kinase family protein [Opitutaceae bacterium]
MTSPHSSRRPSGAIRLLPPSEKVVVLDDDPTGTQTVHGIDILSSWSVETLVEALRDPRRCFYILTNSRALPAREAASVTREVAANLATASRGTGVPFSVISRSDSTLRGHFTEELEAIEAGLGVTFDAKIVIPAFFESGRVTSNNVHYAVNAGRLVPVADTEFARDRTFGYAHSDLTEWIEEKTLGRHPAHSVASISIATLRGPNGADAVTAQLLSIPKGGFLVVNAMEYSDLEVFTEGLVSAEAKGKRYLARSAASFVQVRSGLEARALLAPAEVSGPQAVGGLIVVGSYVKNSTEQLLSLLQLPSVVGIELSVDRLAEESMRAREIARAAEAATGAIRSGLHAVVFTSRGTSSTIGEQGDLKSGQIVSAALVAVVKSISERPRFLVSKGGITSSDIAVRGLGMKKATVLGQVLAGVPVWKMGSETRYPGMNLVVWPGNVGHRDGLRDFVRNAETPLRTAATPRSVVD